MTITGITVKNGADTMCTAAQGKLDVGKLQLTPTWVKKDGWMLMMAGKGQKYQVKGKYTPVQLGGKGKSAGVGAEQDFDKTMTSEAVSKTSLTLK